MPGLFSHLKKLDWLLIGATALLFIMGLLTLYASPGAHEAFVKQSLFGAVALFLIIGGSFADYRFFRENSAALLSLYATGATLLALLFVAGSRIRGVAGWFVIGDLAIQPVEIVKVILILVLAAYFSRRHIELYRLRHLFVSGLYVALPAGLVLIQPDLGSALILAALWVGMVVISGIRLKQFLLILLVAIVAVGFLWGFGLQDYQKNRVTGFLNPQADPLGQGYQTRQAVIAIGSGGFFGKGLGEGAQTRLGFLPEYQTDFIFAAIGEEWGLVGALFVLGVWAVLFWRLFHILQYAENNFARLYVGGVLLVLFIHVAINIGTNLGLMPVTGISLPFISAGGSNLLSMAVALGLVQSVVVRSTLPPVLQRRSLEELES